ncbi:MAG: HXXEE domain-containing protein [Pyrinomonadaceae bacterium]
MAFLVLILLQVLHSVEEFTFKFYEVFPPMALLYRGAPRLAGPAFIISNSLLITVGLVCFFHWVAPGRPGARVVIWLWVGAEVLNAMAHSVWAIMVGGYNPGLVTSLGFVPVAAYMIYLLRRAPPEVVA